MVDRWNGSRSAGTASRWGRLGIAALLLTAVDPLSAARRSTPSQVDFDRDVRPILSENCFACHGMDANKRQAGLRLDTGEGALKRLPTGHTAIVPGNLTSSAKSNACATEKGTLITADEAYKAQTGSYTDTTGLVASGLLKSTPANYAINASGTTSLTSANPGACT